MASRSSSFILLVCAACLWLTVAEPQDFLRKVSMREVEADLQAILADVTDATSRLSAIEARTWQTFQALPKNAAGRLAPPAVRYLVHGYFAKEHGWLIKGLEPHGMQMNATQVHDMSILQDKAPLVVETLLESRQKDRGLSLSDVVTMIAVLEQMLFDESVTLLQGAYRLNGLSLEEKIDEPTLHRVLISYLLLFGQGAKADLFDFDKHKILLASSRARTVQEFEHDTVLNFEFARQHLRNPFKPVQYSFEGTLEIMQDLAQRHGKWQNSECRDMKAHLVELDPEGLGVVPLGLFYAQPQGPSYHFSESADYLRQIGALDETSADRPKVFIANYVGGPSNCIASSAYYSVCCLSECANILGDLERHVAAPKASPESLLALLGKVADAPFTRELQGKLHAISKRHDGEVPLHGRLFAQWLHFAFPHECPFPSVLESATALTVRQWIGARSVASEHERNHHVTSSEASKAPLEQDFDIDGRWSDHEVLPLHDLPRARFSQLGAGAMRAGALIAIAIVVMRSALSAWRAATVDDGKAKKNDDDFAPGFRV